MLTIKDIAKMSGVSPGTVSNVLNGKRPVAEETRARVMQVIQEMNYQPDHFAQGLRQRKSNLIGIIAEEIVQFSTPPIIEGIMSFCEKQGYRIVLENLRFYSRWGRNKKEAEENFVADQNQAFNRMKSLNVDGIVYIGAHIREVQNIPYDLGLPMILVYGYDSEHRIPNIILDDVKGGYEATQYLISMGHKKIGVLGGLEENEHAKKRIQGYQKALYERGLPYNPAWVVYGGWQIEDGYHEVQKLLDTDVTAIFCMNDQVAGGAYKYINERNGEIGKDISVMGFDNIEMTECFCPPLTTMKIPFGEIGKRAAEFIVQSLEEREEQEEQYEQSEKQNPQTMLITCELVERKSVAKLNAE